MQRQVLKAMFESSVNSEYSKTADADLLIDDKFESSVNSEYSKTAFMALQQRVEFCIYNQPLLHRV